MGNKRITCAACGHVGNVSGRGNWHLVHSCPEARNPTPDVSCPLHGSVMQWHVGPFSTFKQCSAPNCAAGKDRKGYAVPYRVYPDKGANAQPAPKSEPSVAPTAQPSNPEPTPTPVTPTVAPKEPTMATPASLIPSTPLAAYGPLGDAIASYVEARANEIASEMVVEALKNHQSAPLGVNWTINHEPFAKVEGTAHKAVSKILRKIAQGFRNFFLVGPAGTGKTTIAQTLAQALNNGDGVRWAELSCSAGLPESRIIGRSVPNVNGGEPTYEGTPFVDIYEHGGVFLMDENDRSDANTMTCINSALANGHMSIPRHNAPIAHRHPDAIILCAANTYGTGPDRQYVGANQLDAAYLDRFVGCTIDVDYDRDLEARISGNPHVCARVWTIREKASSLKLRRIVGTRFLLSVARMVAGGDTIDDAISDCMTGWTSDERSKVGVAS